MSNLESIVPPLEDCQLIQSGEFADSALMWVLLSGKWVVVPRANTEEFRSGHIYPAPTLAEIMEKLPYTTTCEKSCDFSIWYHGTIEEGLDITAAALRLWMKINGIEVSNV